MDANSIVNALVPFVQAHPQLAVVFLVLQVSRFVFKPIMSVLDAYVAATPSLVDDEALNSFKSGKIYKAISFLMDYLLSIKLDVLSNLKK